MLTWLHIDLDLHKQRPTDFNNKNINFLLIQEHTILYRCCRVSAISTSSLEWNLLHPLTKPSFDDITIGVNVPCSSCKITLLHCFLLSFLLTLQRLVRFKILYVASWPKHQKQFPDISRQASSHFFTVCTSICSPKIFWSCGSTWTSLLFCFNNLVVIVLIWLCRVTTKPILCMKWHIASETLTCTHVSGRLVSSHWFRIPNYLFCDCITFVF